jgi:hypothetical protein
VAERFFEHLVGIGLALPRWFEWRRSLVTRLQGQPEDVTPCLDGAGVTMCGQLSA